MIAVKETLSDARSAVHRKTVKPALRWLLWSRRNFIVAVASVVAAAFLTVIVNDVVNTIQARKAYFAAQAAASNTPATPTPTTSTAGANQFGIPTGSPTSADTDPDKTAAAAAATGFVNAWLAGSTAPKGSTAWTKQAATFALPEVAASLKTIPQNLIPTTTLTRVTIPLVSLGYATARATLSDGSVISVQVAHVGDRWLVSNFEPAE